MVEPAIADLAALALRGRSASAAIIHLLTSPVAGKISVDAALAVGGEPSLSQDVGEVLAFAPRSRGLLVNLGMCDAARLAAADAALNAFDGPWTLDPVKVDRSPDRLAAARALVARGPAVVKANAAEADAFGPIAATLWTTGPVDTIVGPNMKINLANGHIWMTRTTAIGCAAGAVLTTLLTQDAASAAQAAAAAALLCGVAGELAAARCSGPGGFPAAWIDALATVDAGTLIRCARPVDV